MSSKAKIVVLHLKELVYTGLFILLGILFVVLLIIMFLPDKDTPAVQSNPEVSYVPGVYTTSLELKDQTVDIEVVVVEHNINSIRIVSLDDAITTMYPLIEPSLNDLANQILSKQSLEEITYSEENKYTSLVLLDAIRLSLKKATVSSSSISSQQQ